MSPRALSELVALAAIWGASFLMMRLGASDFGTVSLAFMRVVLACAVLLPVVAHQHQLHTMLAKWRTLLLVGVLNSALPFLAYAYAAAHITTGLAAVVNATTPLWGAVIAWMWLQQRPGRGRVVGLLLGFCGVFWLVFDKTGLGGNAVLFSQSSAVWACLGATLCYGISANVSQRFLSDVPPVVSAAGTQLGALAVLLVPGWVLWPPHQPSAVAWLSMAVLGIFCTGLAYLLFFRLISQVGSAKAVSVTFLIPVFAVLWGALFLSERITTTMALACLLIVAGTALATGLVSLGGSRRSAPVSGDDRLRSR